MKSKIIFAMALTPFLLNASLQYKPALEAEVELVADEELECISPFHIMHANFRHTESKGVGYSDGYTTLEIFGVYALHAYFMPFLDLRGHVFNNGKLAGNFGLGERSLISSIDHTFGLYLYYDIRQDEHHLTANQLSPGIELVGKRMEYRINAYFPLGRSTSHGYHHKFSHFQGNQIFYQQSKKFAMTGADAEIGSHLTQSTRHDFYAGLGPYYFTAKSDSLWGGKARLYWRYQEYISLEATYSYDHIFKNTVQGTLTFSYPFGPQLRRIGKNCPNPNDLALSRVAFAPYRFEIPVVETKKQRKVAMNPATGQPWRVWFVRNTSSSAGTFESPFPTLAQAQNASGPSDMIYVFQGDGTSRGMDAGIVLQNGQALFGAGTAQTINTSVGRMKIPAHSTFAPLVTTLTTNGNVITLANGNEVSGLNIVSPVNAGFAHAIGGFQGINGANIHDNIITTNINGIGFLGRGRLTVTNNVIRGTNTIVGTGLEVALSNGQFAQIDFSNNVISKFNAGMTLQKDSVTIGAVPSYNALISGNAISDFLSWGMNVQDNIPNSTLQIINNNITFSTVLVGGLIVSPGDRSRSFIDGNTVSAITPGTTIPSVLVQNLVGSPVSAQVSMTNNQVVGKGGANGDGIRLVVNDPGSVFCTSIANNQVQLLGSAGSGIKISAPGGVVNLVDFSNNISPNDALSGNVNMTATCGQ